MTAIQPFEGNQRFEVLTRLGQGGMGAVYQVLDHTRKVRVALKSIGRVPDDRLLRFKREYRALQEIRHPNLVELGELFELDQHWYFTMELIDGVDFYAHVRGERTSSISPAGMGFSEARLRRGLAGLVSGVAALHARGLLHRDLKPANVLVGDDGRVVLIDVGLLSGLERTAQSSEQPIIGTVAYMSPEQAAGEPIGPASDWYSLGVMLYECLTGQLPIDDSQPRLLLRKQLEVPAAPRKLVPEVPADLDALCMALLAIDARKRPSVQEIYRRLHVESQTPDTRPSSAVLVSGLPEVFVGRADELLRLSQAFARTFAGQQRSVNIVGPSGAGKSALLRQFQAQLNRDAPDALVLRSQCYEHETVPYKALRGVMDGLSHWLNDQPSDLVNTLLPAEIRRLATTFPALERVPAVDRAPPPTRHVKDPQEKRLSLLTGVRELFRRIGEQRRTVLILEDMQWSDEDSARLLHELTRAPDAPPLLIVYSCLAAPQDSPTGRTQLSPESSEQIVLAPFTREDSSELVRRILPDPSATTLQRIIDRAQGTPFLLTALAQASGARKDDETGDGASLLKDLLNSLTAPARALLEVISLAGFPLAKHVAAEAAGVAPEDLIAELAQLRAARWVRTTGPLASDLVEPSHDQVRRSILEELSPARTAELHRALASALDLARAEPDRIAHHYLHGGVGRKAAQHLQAAAERALSALAFDCAAALLAQQIQLNIHEPAEEKGLLIARGDALASAGRGPEAAEAYGSAVRHCTGTMALDMKRRVAEQYLNSGRFDEGMKACSAFLDDFGIPFPPTTRRGFFELMMLRTRIVLRGQAFKTRQPEQVAPEELARIDALWSMAKGLTNHDLIRSQVFQARGVLRALAAGEPYRIARALSLEYAATLVQSPNREPHAAPLFERATKLASELDNPHALGLAYFCKGLGLYAGPCRWAEALDSFEQGLGILRSECRDAAWEVSQSIQHGTNCRMYMGNWRALRDSTRDCQDALARGDLYLGQILRGHVLSFLRLLEDCPEAAAEEVQLGFGPLAPSPINVFNHQLGRLRVLQYSGRAEEARALAATQRKSLVDSLLLGAPLIRVLTNEMALHNLLLAAELNQDRNARLKQAAKLASKLERDGIGAAVPSGHLGRAAIAHASGQTERALMWLERAESGFADHQRDADSAAARRRRGQLLGGESGVKLVSSAERWFTEQGTRNIPAMCRLLAPGFAGLDA